MKKEKIYKIGVVILLILNLLQLAGFLFAPKPPKPKQVQFEQEAVEILHLNDQQKQEFYASAKKHHQAMKSLIEKQKELTASYFEQPKEIFLNEIKKIEAQKIKVTETNFNEIEQLLHPNQKSYFKKFKNRALKIILR